MRRAITTATTIFTSPGKASRAIPTSSRATSRSSCTACPTAPATCKNSRTWWQGSRRKSDSRAESTTASSPAYTPDEMMAAVAARELRDGEVVFVGIGLPNLACNLARATHAPNLVLIYESGAVGAVPERLPVSIGDPSLVTGSLMVCGMADVFQSLLQNGRIEVGFLGGAQIDRFGNINTTVVGAYDHPDVRLPGLGGAAHGRPPDPAAPRARPPPTLPEELIPSMSAAATTPAPATAHPALPRALDLRDMVLFNLVAVVSLRWFATAAAAGPSSITLWVLAALLFFVPQGLAVSDLAARYPDEGGIYSWTKRAFGEGHGFLCGWCYWVNNILYYPNLLMSTAVVGTFVIGRGGSALEGSWLYVLPATLVALWLAVALNIVGVRTGRWLQNLGA